MLKDTVQADKGEGAVRVSLRNRRLRADERNVRRKPSNPWTQGDRRLERERGQAMVEFALIAPLFIMLVAGIIQFGIALNFWLDMQRIANQGARWAAVNNWPPDCPRGSTYADCDGDPNPTLQQTLRDEILSVGLEDSASIEICFPNGTSQGNPVQVRLEAPFTLVPILGFGTITLAADATMRLEQKATAYVADVSPPC